ncbi:MAG TPA: glycosyltransferase [Acidimicrobiales bacterium]|nr:glycosyltransferase [Acidimicrobiales bacterium]
MGETSGLPRAKVLFYRDYRGFSGGHMKMWHYFTHVLASPGHEPLVRFSRQSVWDDTNPWLHCRERVVSRWSRPEADVLFLGGVDWRNLPARQRDGSRRPIVNLVQHVDHADPHNVRYSFLRHRAIRICVSEEITAAITDTGRVNGPIFTIPDAIDLEALEDVPRPPTRDVDVLIVANKSPDVGRRLHRALQDRDLRVDLLAGTVPRQQFLARLTHARVAVFAPNRTEGFYLPALEAMALGTLVVCPDCVGNRSFCLPGQNSFRPHYDDKPMLDDVTAALELPLGASEALVAGGLATARAHDLRQERQAFLAILADLDWLWAAG